MMIAKSLVQVSINETTSESILPTKSSGKRREESVFEERVSFLKSRVVTKTLHILEVSGKNSLVESKGKFQLECRRTSLLS